MAHSFSDTLKHTLQFEGGYVNDPTDNGGETFRGISRKSWPKWPGWALIDQAKAEGFLKAKDIDARFKGDLVMESLVAEVYEKAYWEPTK